MAEIRIYTKSYCPYCHRAKSMLESMHLKYEEIPVDDPIEQQKLIDKTNHMTVPQIFIDEKFIGGYDDLVEAKKSGELDELLREK